MTSGPPPSYSTGLARSRSPHPLLTASAAGAPSSSSTRARGGSDASSSTLGKSSATAGATANRREASALSGGQYGTAGRRKVRTEPPFAKAHPPTPPDSPGPVPSLIFAPSALSSHHSQQPSASGQQLPSAATSSSFGQHALPPPVPYSAPFTASSPVFSPSSNERLPSELSESSTRAAPLGPPWGSGSTLHAGSDVEKHAGAGATGLGLAGVDEEDPQALAGGQNWRPSWWVNPILSPASFRGKFGGGSGSSSTPALPGDGARSYFPSILGGPSGNMSGAAISESPAPAVDVPLPPSPSGFATPTRPKRAATHRPNFRLSIPAPSQSWTTYTEHHSKTPGWAEPYTSLTSRRKHNRSLSRARGDHLLEKGLSTIDDDDHAGVRASVKKRIQRWTLYSFWTPLFLRLANFALTCTTLGLAVRIRNAELRAGLRGITGPSPLVAIIYSPPALLHVLSAIYLEYFGKPIGLWTLPSKLQFMSLDLVVISLWASLLSLTMSDIFSSPLHCVPDSSRWWTSLPSTGQTHVGGVCDAQIAMVVSVILGVVGFGLGNVVSLARTWVKIADRNRSARGVGFGFGGRR